MSMGSRSSEAVGTWDCKANVPNCQEIMTLRALQQSPPSIAGCRRCSSGGTLHCKVRIHSLGKAVAYGRDQVVEHWQVRGDSWPGVLHMPGVNLQAIFGAIVWNSTAQGSLYSGGARKSTRLLGVRRIRAAHPSRARSGAAQ
jgi:hypothetical protein